MKNMAGKFAGAMVGVTSNTGTTDVRIKDIDLNLIDEDEENEYYNGYEDIEMIKDSIEQVGMKSIISVYEMSDGRYKCFSGHSRLRSVKSIGKEKKISCQVFKEPENDNERIKNMFFLNIQRNKRPLYIARTLVKYKEVLRAEGFTGNVDEEVGRIFGYKRTAIFRYCKILQLPEQMQELCKYQDFPFTILVELYQDIPNDKVDVFCSQVKEKLDSDGAISGAELKDIANKLQAPDQSGKTTSSLTSKKNKNTADEYILKLNTQFDKKIKKMEVIDKDKTRTEVNKLISCLQSFIDELDNE